MKALSRALIAAENFIAFLSAAAIILLPLADGIIRIFLKSGIPAGEIYVRHAVLVLAFAGAVLATREKRHLGLAGGGEDRPAASGRLAGLRAQAAAVIAALVCAGLSLASLSFALVAFGPGDRIGILSSRLIASIMPLGFALCAMHFALDPKLAGKRRLIALAALAGGLFLGSPAIANAFSILAGAAPPLAAKAAELAAGLLRTFRLPLVLALIAGAAAGTPLFAILGGIALVLFGAAGVPMETIPQEAYSLLQDGTIPAIPLFTLAGFLLAEGSSGERLVALARRVLGKLPGGSVIAAVVACVFFSTFTGATGVTILALGGLLSFVLVKADGRGQDPVHGLLTAADSLGLLFPPSLAVIIYGVTMQIDVIHLFMGSLLPGLLISAATIALGIYLTGKGRTTGAAAATERARTELRTGLKSAFSELRRSWLELLLPLLIAGGYFTGLASLAETGALAVVLLIVVNLWIRKDIAAAALPSIALKALATAGGVLVILASARGLASYIIDASIPEAIAAWVRLYVSSPLVFLLLVNLGLLVTGCFMDIFSAILVVAPLLAPLAEAFGIDPIRFGVIFLANMGIGFLTPPIGMNLFLGSYAFKRPVSSLYRLVAPYFLVQLACVLAITYLPILTTLLLPR